MLKKKMLTLNWLLPDFSVELFCFLFLMQTTIYIVSGVQQIFRIGIGSIEEVWNVQKSPSPLLQMEILFCYRNCVVHIHGSVLTFSVEA